jgi:two-component system phosphate regulon sensor histidine kinase PhoR
VPSTENLTRITLAVTHHYRVVMEQGEQERFDRVLGTFRKGVFGFVSACLFALVVFAGSLFHRARKAQALADLRTDFVAAVSHELRTPLASVRMFAELLEAGSVPEDERNEVEQALAGETRRLSATLDRMLRFGALARGKLEPQKTVQPLAPIVEAACARAHAAGAVVEADSALTANVDGGLLGLALDNLLSNAKKYAPDGGPYRVRARADRKWAYIDVVDRGPGLGWRARRLIWKPFERADARLSKATEGSGVGLALVRGIARAHGGDAAVTSKPGQGATFTLRLPRA